MLLELHQTYPVYGFNAHAGYGTPQHLAALREHGPCEHHRRSFAPVREAYQRFGTASKRLPAGNVIVVSGTLTDITLDDDAFGERSGV
jgi:ribonuclease HII